VAETTVNRAFWHNHSGLFTRVLVMHADSDLVQIVDAAMAEAVAKSGSFIACHPGCHECCIGPFPITPLDAIRLRQGLAALEASDPERAARVRDRAIASVGRLRAAYPESTLAAILALDDAAQNEPCPALEPATGRCDLYSARPITCRAFGPAVSFNGNALAVCELCYHGASEHDIAACRVEVDPENLEGQLLAALPEESDTIVAFALICGPL
jgi:Fe-S-cluster containining protein